MPDFSAQFSGYLIPGPDRTAEAITTGMIVLDTNVLLGAYRFAPKAREELLSALHRLGDRLWIPHQVALEFHRNRFSVIADHDAAYKTVLESVAGYKETISSELEDKIRQLSNRTALPDKERDRLISMANRSLHSLEAAVEGLRKSHGLSGPTGPDAVLTRIQSLLTNRVGSPYEGDDLTRVSAEAARRLAAKIPPGFKDAAKGDSSGDYFVWSQTVDEASRRKPPYLVFVTGDIKDDWYLRVKGQTIMARPELSDECLQKSGARLVMMQTRSFLRQASESLHAPVSSETLEQADSLDLRIRKASSLMSTRRVEEARKRQYHLDRGLNEVALRLELGSERKRSLEAQLQQQLEAGNSDAALALYRELSDVDREIAVLKVLRDSRHESINHILANFDPIRNQRPSLGQIARASISDDIDPESDGEPDADLQA
ncbi:PIN-like domain-containing protein [Micromonospora sp. NPDC002411]